MVLRRTRARLRASPPLRSRECPMPTFVQSWKSAKQKFETDTGKKKPSEKFLGVIRKGSGVEQSLEKIDAIASSAKWAELPVAHKDFTKQETAYIEAAKLAGTKETEYKALLVNINELVNALRKIGDDVSDLAKRNEGGLQVTVEELIGKGNFDLACKGAALDASVTSFFVQKNFVNTVTGKQDQALIKLHEQGAKCLKTYKDTLARLRSAKGAPNPRTNLLKFTRTSVSDMLDAVGKMGLLGVLTTYSTHQGMALQAAKRPASDSALLKLAQKAAGPLNAEFNNLTKVAAFLDNVKN